LISQARGAFFYQILSFYSKSPQVSLISLIFEMAMAKLLSFFLVKPSFLHEKSIKLDLLDVFFIKQRNLIGKSVTLTEPEIF